MSPDAAAPTPASTALRLALRFFLAVTALVVGRTAADTLFLSRSEFSLLPLLYLGIALLTSVGSLAYARGRRRWGGKGFDAGVSLALAATTSLLYLFLKGRAPWSYPLLAVWADVGGTLALLQVTTRMSEAFTTREGKLWVPWITAAGPAANVVCGLAVAGVVHAVGTEALVLGAAGALLGAALLPESPAGGPGGVVARVGAPPPRRAPPPAPALATSASSPSWRSWSPSCRRSSTTNSRPSPGAPTGRPRSPASSASSTPRSAGRASSSSSP